MVSDDVRARALAWAEKPGPTEATDPPVAVAAASAPTPASLATAQPPRPSDLALDIAAALARRFEGLYLTPYLCPAAVATIGYGATRYENGVRVTLKDQPITRERAEDLLMHGLRIDYLPSVLKLCPAVSNAKQLAALVDFTFNLGAGNLAASTLRRRVNEGNWEEARIEILRWNKGGGRVLKGLTLRRQAECALL